MIVKNEEKYLRDCLESVKGVADEIVLVDTGSTDTTIQIAKEFGARIFYFKWINDFAAARNYSLQQCSGDWVLYLDADERLAAKSVNHLKKITSKRSKTAYFCQVCSVDEVNNRPSIMSYVRLFPNEKTLKFEGAIHEQIEYSLHQNKIHIENSPIEILHIGYNLTKDGLIVKAKRNLEILLNEYEKNKTSYYAFQLGQTYGILEKKPEAVKYFNIAVQDPSLKPEYQSTAYRYLSIDFTDRQDWNKALEMIEKSIQRDQNQPLALMAASQIFLKLSRNKEAEIFCERAYEVNSRLLKQGGASNQVILLSEKDIIHHCLNIAVAVQNNIMFNNFYIKLKKSGIGGILELEIKIFEILLNNKKFELANIDELSECLNETNLNVFNSMLDNYTINDCKINILKVMAGKFPQYSSVLNKLGLALSEQKNIDEAASVLEKSLEINPDDPSTVFYLISIYLQKNNIQKIDSLINHAKIKYSGIPAIIDKLNLIEHRIHAK
jgi:glycosyltransferase involved in cell wall biosynthesis